MISVLNFHKESKGFFGKMFSKAPKRFPDYFTYAFLTY